MDYHCNGSNLFWYTRGNFYHSTHINTYHQLSIFGESKPKRIYLRDNLGRFSSGKMSELESLQRENNRLKNEVEMYRRKAEALAHYKIEMDRYNQAMEDAKIHSQLNTNDFFDHYAKKDVFTDFKNNQL